MKVKTITLTGEETKVEFDGAYSFVEINNSSKNEILASTNSGIVRGNDDVVIISAKTIVTIGDTGSPGIKEIYVSGEGEIQMIAKNYAEHCFNDPASGGGSDENIPAALKFLPHPENISAFFDYENGAESDGWINQVTGDKIPMSLEKLTDGIKFLQQYDFYESNMDSYTIYIVVQCKNSQKQWDNIIGNSAWQPGLADQVVLATSYQDCFGIRTANTNDQYYGNINAFDDKYHICVLSVYRNSLYLYIDGKFNYKNDNIFFPYPYGWSVFTSGSAFEFSIKNLMYTTENTIHNDGKIIENSNALAQKYGIEI